MDDQELTESMQKLLIVMQRLDEKIGPMLESDGELFNKRYTSYLLVDTGESIKIWVFRSII
jgi:hypothetical protein